MTFEEFFTKKRIDLTALQAGEPGLFTEFRKHYEQMGEKSFDHTKKYWFNKLRLQYHLAAGLKPEKVHIENRLAEQTIVETLTESIPVSKAQSREVKAEIASATEDAAIPKPAGFKPRFKPGMASPKPAEENTAEKQNQPKAESIEPKAERTPATEEGTTPKPAGFKPRFNAAKMAAPKTEVAEENTENALSGEQKAETALSAEEPAAPKPAGFKPRFNATKMSSPKSEAAEDKKEEAPTPEAIIPSADEIASAEPTAPKPAGFKPRFNMKMVAKPAEDTTTETEPKVKAPEEPKAELTAQPAIEQSPPAEPETPAEPTAPKPAGFKPRFNAAKMKPKSPEE